MLQSYRMFASSPVFRQTGHISCGAPCAPHCRHVSGILAQDSEADCASARRETLKRLPVMTVLRVIERWTSGVAARTWTQSCLVGGGDAVSGPFFSVTAWDGILDYACRSAYNAY